MSDLSSLIERLEKAEGPSRELDVEIMNAVDPRSPDEKRLFGGKVYPATWGAVGQICDQIRYFVEAPRLTSSIDAAVSLAERMLPSLSEIRPETYVGGEFHHCEIETEDGDFEAHNCPNPAIAICLATLRALNQKGSSNG